MTQSRQTMTALASPEAALARRFKIWVDQLSPAERGFMARLLQGQEVRAYSDPTRDALTGALHDASATEPAAKDADSASKKLITWAHDLPPDEQTALANSLRETGGPFDEDVTGHIDPFTAGVLLGATAFMTGAAIAKATGGSKDLGPAIKAVTDTANQAANPPMK